MTSHTPTGDPTKDKHTLFRWMTPVKPKNDPEGKYWTLANLAEHPDYLVLADDKGRSILYCKVHDLIFGMMASCPECAGPEPPDAGVTPRNTPETAA